MLLSETRSVAAPEQGSSGPALSTAFCAFCKEFVSAFGLCETFEDIGIQAQELNVTVWVVPMQTQVLASDHSLDTLPRRPVDQSLCLRNRDVGDKKRVIYNMSIRTDKQPVVVRRPEGRLEKLYRTRCTRCDLVSRL